MGKVIVQHLPRISSLMVNYIPVEGIAVRVIESSNFDEDYYNEKFVSHIPLNTSRVEAQAIADIINKNNSPHDSAYFKVVDNDYKLRTFDEY